MMKISYVDYSGWPSENSAYDCSTEKGKRRFLKDMEKFEGIKLTPKEIQYNDALRSEAKLAMNSYVKNERIFNSLLSQYYCFF